MLATIEHSFACKTLMEKNIKIFRDGTRILNQLYPHDFEELKSYIILRKNYAEKYLKNKMIKKSNDYEYLKSLGWKITSTYDSGFFDYQRIKYSLVPSDSHYDDYGRMPKNHNFEIDLKDQMIKFNGDNVSETGTTGWIQLNPKRKKSLDGNLTPFQIHKIHSRAATSFQDNLPDNLKSHKNENLIEIPEAIVGITENAEICCIEKTDESPKISISGESGKGKTMLMNELDCQFYYKFGWNIININDVKGDTQTRCLPWDKFRDMRFIKELSYFKEPTLPLPYVYLCPTIKGIKNEDIFHKDEVGFEISFPLKKLVSENLINYNPNWELNPKARKYFINLIYDKQGNERTDGLLHLKTLEEIEDLIDHTIPEKMDTLKDSLKPLISDIWNRRILDSTTGINAKWKAQIKEIFYEFSPPNICLLCGLIPSIITQHVRNQDWFAMWIKHILEDLFLFSETEDYQKLSGKNIIIDGDELAEMLRTEATKKILDKVIREGRTKYIGFNQSTQYFKDIPDSIITNLTHYFFFKTQSSTDFKLIKRMFDLNKTQEKEIKNLDKFECYAFGNFILYNSEGEKYSNDQKPIKIIRTKPPNAQNYAGYRKLKKVIL